MSKHEMRSGGSVDPSFEMGIQTHLGRSLRRVYDQTLTEPIPDRFLDLLASLETRPAPQDHPNMPARSERIAPSETSADDGRAEKRA